MTMSRAKAILARHLHRNMPRGLTRPQRRAVLRATASDAGFPPREADAFAEQYLDGPDGLPPAALNRRPS